MNGFAPAYGRCRRRGTPVQIIQARAAVNAMESADGKTLYYAKGIMHPGDWKMPAGGGEEVRLLELTERRAMGHMALGPRAPLYVARWTERTCRPGSRFFFTTSPPGRPPGVAQLASRPPVGTRGLSISADGRSLLFTQLDSRGMDLMLLENLPLTGRGLDPSHHLLRGGACGRKVCRFASRVSGVSKIHVVRELVLVTGPGWENVRELVPPPR